MGVTHYRFASETFNLYESSWFRWIQRNISFEAINSCSTAWFTLSGCTCNYSYGNFLISPSVMPHPLLKLGMYLCRKLGISRHPPNSLNINRYDDCNQYIASHSDDEKLFGGKTQAINILSVSFGHSRDFKLRWKSGGEEQTVRLQSGDAVVMAGMCQKFVKHSVPVESSSVDDHRYNLTYRWIVEHDEASFCKHATA